MRVAKTRKWPESHFLPNFRKAARQNPNFAPLRTGIRPAASCECGPHAGRFIYPIRALGLVNDSHTPRRTFAENLALFRAGDPDATREFVKRYNPVLREAVSRRLPKKLRREFESFDFVQEVWAAVCGGGAARRASFTTEDELHAYLVEVAVNRLTDALRHRSTQRYGPGAPVETLGVAAGSDPTPSQFAIADERWNAIVNKLPLVHRSVVQRLREGFTQQEIANLTGVPLRTISRIVQRVQRDCEEVAI